MRLEVNHPFELPSSVQLAPRKMAVKYFNLILGLCAAAAYGRIHELQLEVCILSEHNPLKHD